ncbi:MAG: arylsulfatase [Proteobacteria bacterium]|nr:arylsulfatase [Pseudomonadota bacterium]
MKKLALLTLSGVLALMMGCEGSAIAQGDALDRTSLPIQPPVAAPITELDARNVTPPPPFNITPPEGAPNVVIVLIDDIGFGATEPFGGAIETPTFSQLAENGLRFNQFHTTALCSPTRASLLAGRNHHVVNVGSVMEIATGFPGNQGRRPDNAKYYAEILRQNGYSTAAFGKWHETAPWETSVSGPFFRWPTNSGFDKFYGFIGGETNQWDPVIYDGVTKVEREDDPDYHFTTDMTDQAVSWVRFQQAMTPDQPFFIYYAPGAAHAPHHAPIEWRDKYKGRFADGWDALREETLARQKAMGIVPDGTVLAGKPDEIKDWEELTEQEQQLFELQMETFAGFMEHTDVEIGRLVDAIDGIGELDNTLFVYIMGDNGSSAEGGLIGTFNELLSLNGIFGVETVESMLAIADDWGGPDSFPHMAAGWTVATDTPFKWTKQVAGDYGGTRNGMVMHWPNGFKSRGEVRSQWSHVNDIGPTVLEAAGLPMPDTINGIPQLPMDGVSLLYATDDADAAERHTTQYFEMFGNRAIYHEGWLARVVHGIPWHPNPIRTLQEDIWELYDTTVDFSLANDLAAENPEKLAELQAIFDREAIANNVYPLDDRRYERFDPAQAGRPDLMGGRTSLTLADGMDGMLENTFINIKNRSKTVTANVELVGNDRGIILTQGGKFGGWALYMDGGKPAYTYNWFGLEKYTIASDEALPAGSAEVKVEFAYDGGGPGKGGLATLYVNGEKVSEGRVERTTPAVFSGDETADVGKDDATQVVAAFENVRDSHFTGSVKSVTVGTAMP